MQLSSFAASNSAVVTPVVVRDVRKSYVGSGDTVSALAGVSLEVRAGEMVALVGPSGCGKSTLLNLVGCVDLPTSGQVIVDGRVTSDLDDDALTILRRDRVGTIFQFFNLLPALNISDNVGLPLVLRRLPKAQIAARVEAALVEVGIADKRSAYSTSSRAVSMTIAASEPASRARRQTSTPLIPGSIQSSTTASRPPSPIRSSAARPSAATSTM
jgi:ABC-type proline/glycine betaine transport system ATPase subunit